MPNYTITEPHPTVAANSYTHAGRGGVGNMFRAPTTTPAAGVPTKAKASSSSTGRFYSGRGGAGNAHTASERTAISFDEEFSRAEVREKQATISYVGRGGAGNIFSTSEPRKERKHSSSSAHSFSSRRDSASTDASTRSGFLGRLSNTFSRS
ncbi:hypothetical protein GQ53DRAFT_109945 [Thozetella sp. PMI_491]|nr:hypothetical protein GQ53DRAFT_109945 [Thozetella sp. PMI_491]